MKKTIRKVVPLALLMLIPCLNANAFKVENQNCKIENSVFNKGSSSKLKTTIAGKIIVRNVLRK